MFALGGILHTAQLRLIQLNDLFYCVRHAPDGYGAINRMHMCEMTLIKFN